MITIRPGSRAYNLLLLLSLVGEYPMRSLSIIGNERDLKQYIRQLETIQDYRYLKDGKVYRGRMMQVSGRSKARTLRLNKGVLPILNSIHPEALENYMNTYRGHVFSGDHFHVLRNHRISEALAMCWKAGIEVRPYLLPKLQREGFRNKPLDCPSYYIAKDLKKIDTLEQEKTAYTRIVGILFYPGGVYAVYNTREAVMKWVGRGEFKTIDNFSAQFRTDANYYGRPPAILFGKNAELAINTLQESEITNTKEMSLDKIYPQLHFLPMDRNGIRLLRMLVIPDWKNRMLNALIQDVMRVKSIGSVECDGEWEDNFYLSHLDGDIARLRRFRGQIVGIAQKFTVLCYPWQAPFLREYLGPVVTLKQVEMDWLEEVLEITPYSDL